MSTTVEDASSQKGRVAFWRDIRQIPNLLCLYRLLGVIVALGLFYAGFLYAALILGITAGLSDYADGYFARKYNMVTELGALLDPVADLVFAFIGITVAVQEGVWPLYVLILWGLRDISILAVRTSAAQQGFTIPSIHAGKVATNFIFYALAVMLLDIAQPFGPDHFMTFVFHWAPLLAIHVGLVLQWYTAAFYVKRYIECYDPDNVLSDAPAESAVPSANIAAVALQPTATATSAKS